MRNTWRWFSYDALCEECGWRTEGKNGLGVAAQHHDRTGHSVRVEVSGGVSYLSDSDDAALKQRKRDMKTGEGE